MRLNKIEGLKPLLPNRKYGQKWEDLEFGISAQSLIERGDAPLAGYLKLTSGDWRRIEEAETARQAQIESMHKATEELQIKNAKQREIREFRQRNNLNIAQLQEHLKK